LCNMAHSLFIHSDIPSFPGSRTTGYYQPRSRSRSLLAWNLQIWREGKVQTLVYRYLITSITLYFCLISIHSDTTSSLRPRQRTCISFRYPSFTRSQPVVVNLMHIRYSAASMHCPHFYAFGIRIHASPIRSFFLHDTCATIACTLSVLSISSSHSTILQYSHLVSITCTLYRYPRVISASLYSLLVPCGDTTQAYCTLQHSHSHSLSILFNDTRYHRASLVQRHKIPSHYSTSSLSFDFYSSH
jgi:hypothetical protein